MSKEQYYNGIKKFVYRKFEELEVTKSSDENDIYLHYKNDEYARVRIQKNSGIVYYHYEFRDKILKVIRLEKTDFEIILKRWVEDTFQIKVIHTYIGTSGASEVLKIPFKLR